MICHRRVLSPGRRRSRRLSTRTSSQPPPVPPRARRGPARRFASGCRQRGTRQSGRRRSGSASPSRLKRHGFRSLIPLLSHHVLSEHRGSFLSRACAPRPPPPFLSAGSSVRRGRLAPPARAREEARPGLPRPLPRRVVPDRPGGRAPLRAFLGRAHARPRRAAGQVVPGGGLRPRHPHRLLPALRLAPRVHFHQAGAGGGDARQGVAAAHRPRRHLRGPPPRRGALPERLPRQVPRAAVRGGERGVPAGRARVPGPAGRAGVCRQGAGGGGLGEPQRRAVRARHQRRREGGEALRRELRVRDRVGAPQPPIGWTPCSPSRRPAPLDAMLPR